MWTISDPWKRRRSPLGAPNKIHKINNDLLSAVFDALSPHVVLLDRFGRIEHASRSWLEFGRANGAAGSCIGIGADYLNVCHQAAQEGDKSAGSALEAIQGVMERRLPGASMEYPCHEPGPEGKKRWFLLKVDPMPADHGGVVITHTEITDVKLFKVALSETDKQLQLAIEAGQMGVWDLTVETKALSWSEEQFRLMGLEPFSIGPTFDTWAARVHPDDLPSANAALDAAIQLQDTYRSEYRVIWPDGSIHWLAARGRPIYDEQSRCVRVLGLIVDITERKLAAEQLRANMEEAQRLQMRLEADNAYLRGEVSASQHLGSVVGVSAPILEVFNQVQQVAPTEVTVLILGETGTGKELLARSIHALSERRDRPLIKVDCAGLPASLIESELFGHARGAFTGAVAQRVGRFELADGATLFVDEVGELPLEVQGKLLRVLQEQEFERLGSSKTVKINTRIIAATNRDLDRAVREGRFREDLFYRLNVYPIKVPALRARKEDIAPLAETFLAESERRLGRRFNGIPQAVLRRLQDYHWPGNVRELQNVIERAAVTSVGPQLQLPQGFDVSITKHDSQDETMNSPRHIPNNWGVPNEMQLVNLERAHILRALERAQWRIEGGRGAAMLLGLKPSTLRSRMKKLGIRRSLVDFARN